MNSQKLATSAVRWLLAAALVVPGALPVQAFAEDPSTESTETPSTGFESVETSESVTATPSVDATPFTGIEMDPGSWSGLKGRTSDVRLVPFDPGIAKGKNLIVIQVEALQTTLVGKRVYGKELTPRLNDLIESDGTWYFPNTYSQISRGNTSDCEWVMNTSLYPPVSSAAAVRWGDKKVPSMARQLRSEGYYTATFHANEARFWNRSHLYAALGFNRYYDRAFFGTADFWKWGTSDGVVFSKTLSVLKGYKAQKKKFYAQIITMSSHKPFEFPSMSRRPWKTAGVYKGTPTGQYISSISYADQQIGAFISGLKSAGLWNNSVVVIYGDHFGQVKPATTAERNAQQAFYGRSIRSTDRLRVPLIVHVPGQTSRGTITDTVGQIDILPTVADAMGVDISDMRYYGRNAFTDSRAVVGFRGILPNGSYVDNRIMGTPAGFNGGGLNLLTSWNKVPASPLDRRVRADVNRLMDSSLRYTDRLPKRPGATKRARNAIIPNETR